MSYKTKFFEWNVSPNNDQTGVTVGYEFEFRRQNSSHILYNLSTFRENAIDGVISYSYDGSTWLDFPIGDEGKAFYTDYMMRVKINDAMSSNIFSLSDGIISRLSGDSTKTLETFNTGLGTSSFSIDHSNNDVYLYDNSTLYSFYTSDTIRLRKSFSLGSDALDIIVDGSRKVFWQIRDNEVFKKSLFDATVLETYVLPTSIVGNLVKFLHVRNGNICFSANTNLGYRIFELDSYSNTVSADASMSLVLDISYGDSGIGYFVAFGDQYIGKFESGVLDETYIDTGRVTVTNVAGDSGLFYFVNSNEVIKFSMPFSVEWEKRVREQEGSLLVARGNDSSVIYSGDGFIECIRDNGTAFKKLKVGNGVIPIELSGQTNPSNVSMIYRAVYGEVALEQSSSSSEGYSSSSSDSSGGFSSDSSDSSGGFSSDSSDSSQSSSSSSSEGFSSSSSSSSEGYSESSSSEMYSESSSSSEMYSESSSSSEMYSESSSSSSSEMYSESSSSSSSEMYSESSSSSSSEMYSESSSSEGYSESSSSEGYSESSSSEGYSESSSSSEMYSESSSSQSESSSSSEGYSESSSSEGYSESSSSSEMYSESSSSSEIAYKFLDCATGLVEVARFDVADLPTDDYCWVHDGTEMVKSQLDGASVGAETSPVPCYLLMPSTPANCAAVDDTAFSDAFGSAINLCRWDQIGLIDYVTLGGFLVFNSSATTNAQILNSIPSSLLDGEFEIEVAVTEFSTQSESAPIVRSELFKLNLLIGGTRYYIGPRHHEVSNGLGKVVEHRTPNYAITTITEMTGICKVTRDASNNVKLFWDGVQVGSTSVNAGAVTDISISANSAGREITITNDNFLFTTVHSESSSSSEMYSESSSSSEMYSESSSSSEMYSESSSSQSESSSSSEGYSESSSSEGYSESSSSESDAPPAPPAPKNCSGDPDIILSLTGHSSQEIWCGETWEVTDQGTQKRVCPALYNLGGNYNYWFKQITSTTQGAASASLSLSRYDGLKNVIKFDDGAPSFNLTDSRTTGPGNFDLGILTVGSALPTSNDYQINDNQFGSHTIGGITYTWSRGDNW